MKLSHPQMKSQAGVRLAFDLQKIMAKDPGIPVRGLIETDGSCSSLCSHLYSLIRANRSHRRAFLTSLLNLFDEQAVRNCKWYMQYRTQKKTRPLLVSYLSYIYFVYQDWHMTMLINVDVLHSFNIACLKYN